MSEEEIIAKAKQKGIEEGMNLVLKYEDKIEDLESQLEAVRRENLVFKKLLIKSHQELEEIPIKTKQEINLIRKIKKSLTLPTQTSEEI